MDQPMRRFKQQLSNEECLNILSKQPRGILSLIDKEYPYSIPINYYFDRTNNKIYFHVALEGHKLDIIKENNKACLTILDEGYKEANDWAYYFNSIVVLGDLSIVKDQELFVRELTNIGKKYIPTLEESLKAVSKHKDKVLILEMSIKQITGKHVHEK
ncbi:MAG: pyridoxamine 5'-phosphate oxidase family protein [Thomasclavelia sp.]|nr:pyridoxamine 5'-phosphate oxidase family protein [Thomasclavelia sp.]